MSTIVPGITKSFTASVTIAQYSVVALDVNKLKVATVTDGDLNLGTALSPADAGDQCNVQLANAGGTTYGICGVTISAADALYVAAAGKVSTVTTDAGSQYATALEDGAPDAVIEIILA